MKIYNEYGDKVQIANIDKTWTTLHANFSKTIDNKCQKLLKHNISDYNDEVFKILKNIGSDNIYKIYQLFYNKKRTKFLGYETEYYSKDIEDILTQETYYTLNNLYNMYNLFSKLTENSIVANDTHQDNVILQKNNMILIDADYYFKSNLSKEKIELMNLKALAYIFKSLYNQTITDYHPNLLPSSDNISNLFNIKSKNDLDKICKKLSKHKYPLDYLSKSFK